MLVEADHVPSRIAEPRRDLRSVRADRLNDLASMGYHRVNGRCHAVNHDVKKKAWLRGGRTPDNPGAAHLTGGVVKGGATVTTFADVPSEDDVCRSWLGAQCQSRASRCSKSYRSPTWGASVLLEGVQSNKIWSVESHPSRNEGPAKKPPTREAF